MGIIFLFLVLACILFVWLLVAMLKIPVSKCTMCPFCGMKHERLKKGVHVCLNCEEKFRVDEKGYSDLTSLKLVWFYMCLGIGVIVFTLIRILLSRDYTGLNLEIIYCLVGIIFIFVGIRIFVKLYKSYGR